MVEHKRKPLPKVPYRALQRECSRAKKEKRLRKRVQCRGGRDHLLSVIAVADKRQRANYTVGELRRMATAYGVYGRSKMDRNQLVKALGLGYPRSAASLAAARARRRRRRSQRA